LGFVISVFGPVCTAVRLTKRGRIE